MTAARAAAPPGAMPVRARAVEAIAVTALFAVLTCMYLNDALHPGH